MRDLGTECARGSPPRPSDRRGASDCTQGPSLTASILGLGPSRASRPRHFEWPHDVAGGLNLLWNQSMGLLAAKLRAHLVLEHLECSHQPHIQGRGAEKHTQRAG